MTFRRTKRKVVVALAARIKRLELDLGLASDDAYRQEAVRVLAAQVRYTQPGDVERYAQELKARAAA